MSERKKVETAPTDEAAPLAAPVLQAKEIFGDGREVIIEHDGERYRLRITRRGKLILQK